MHSPLRLTIHIRHSQGYINLKMHLISKLRYVVKWWWKEPTICLRLWLLKSHLLCSISSLFYRNNFTKFSTGQYILETFSCPSAGSGFLVSLFSAWGIPFRNPVFFVPQQQHCQQPYLSAWLRYLQIALDLHINMMQNNLLHPVSGDIFLIQTTSNKCIKALLMQPLADRMAPLR